MSSEFNTVIKKVKNLTDFALKISLQFLGSIDPTLALPIGIYFALSDFSKQIYQDQINEYVEFIKIHKEEFLEEVTNTTKFKNIFIQLVRKYFDEISKEKRKLILSYALNLGKGINQEFDDHTKCLRVLDMILPQELITFLLWKDELSGYKSFVALSEEELKNRAEFMNIRNILQRINNEELNLSENDMYYIIKSLNSYGLLAVKEETPTLWGGGSAELKIAGITKFGEYFLQFISS